MWPCSYKKNSTESCNNFKDLSKTLELGREKCLFVIKWHTNLNTQEIFLSQI